SGSRPGTERPGSIRGRARRVRRSRRTSPPRSAPSRTTTRTAGTIGDTTTAAMIADRTAARTTRATTTAEMAATTAAGITERGFPPFPGRSDAGAFAACTAPSFRRSAGSQHARSAPLACELAKAQPTERNVSHGGLRRTGAPGAGDRLRAHPFAPRPELPAARDADRPGQRGRIRRGALARRWQSRARAVPDGGADLGGSEPALDERPAGRPLADRRGALRHARNRLRAGERAAVRPRPGGVRSQRLHHRLPEGRAA